MSESRIQSYTSHPINRTARPESIQFYDSILHLHLNAGIKTFSIDSAEVIMAQIRHTPSFTWMENFDDDDAIAHFSGKLIQPDKIAICYLGDDVRYGVVSVKPIKKGEVLIFTGEVYTEFREDDHTNPYFAWLKKECYINAKAKGGFASMLLDLPSKEDAAYLARRSRRQVDLAVANFDVLCYQFSGKPFAVLTANRDIDAKEVLGIPYASSTRLAYAKYVGFTKDGLRLPSEINEILNKIIYKQILYKGIGLADNDIQLYKIIKHIKNKKLDKAILYLQTNSIKLCNQLLLEELETIKQFMIANPQNNQTTLKHIIINEQKSRIKKKRSFNERKFTELVIAANEKQLEYRNNSDIYFYAGEKSYFVMYPGIYNDFLEIAQQSKLCRKDEEIQIRYGRFLFFNLNPNNNNANTHVDDKLARGLISMNLRDRLDQ